MSIAAAAALYLFANVLRSLRFWLLMKRADLSFTHTLTIYQTTNVLGGLLSAPLAEVARIAALIRLCAPGAVISVISIIVFCRLLDFMVASLPLLVNGMGGAQPVSPGAILAFVLVGAALGFVTCSRDAVSFVKRVLVARGHTAWHLRLVKALNEVEAGFYRFLDHPMSTLVFNLLLTLFIWTLDVLAFMQVSRFMNLPQAQTLWDHVSLWSQHAYGRFFGIVPVESMGIQKYMMWPQAGFAIVLLALSAMTLAPALYKGGLWKSR